MEIPKSKDMIKINDTVYYYDGTNGYKGLSTCGVVTAITEKFAKIDKNGVIIRKKKENLFLNKDKVELLFFKFFDKKFQEEFGISSFEIVEAFEKFYKTSPELLV